MSPCNGPETGNAAFPDPPDCESEITRLRRAWEEAKRRQAANEALAIKLVNAITPATKPDDAIRLNIQATTASGQASDAGADADQYALAAIMTLNELERAAWTDPSRLAPGD